MTRDELIEKLLAIGNGTDEVVFEEWDEDEYGYSCTNECGINGVDTSYRNPNRIVIS